MRIVIAGPKGSGKSSVGKLLSEELGLPLEETDSVIEDIYVRETGRALSCRDIHQEGGDDGFRDIERRAVERISGHDWCIICTGGSTLLDPHSRRLLRANSILTFLHADPDALWKRVCDAGLPHFLSGPNGREVFSRRARQKAEVVLPYADVVVDNTGLSIKETVDAAVGGIAEELATRSTAPNTIGEVIRLTTFGESHGLAIGAVLDGLPPGMELSPEDIQAELDRRRPGQSSITTSRKEEDRARILSGVFEGRTTGAPVCILIENKDQDSSKYDIIRHLFRPGHADFTFWRKYGLRDHRGGGRSSGRETATRVAGGAVAKTILAERGVRIVAYALEIGGVHAEMADYDEIERNPARCPDPEAARAMEQAILDAKSEGDSVGGIVQLEVSGVPAGLGDPVFGKLDAALGKALLSLGAVKGIEFGAGFEAARMHGSECNDPMRDGRFVTNNAGGILGGISNGEDIVVRLAVKPTASVGVTQETCDLEGNNATIRIEGRHDPCIVPRVIPVVECMAALVILDLWETQSRLRPGWEQSGPRAQSINPPAGGF